LNKLFIIFESRRHNENDGKCSIFLSIKLISVVNGMS